ncbi:S41 family peptidase [bacterium]|nr:S41 family peptidase [bacterium]
MDKERKNRIYKIIMIVAIAVFLTFMVTSISLYTYFLNNPISITSKSSSSSKDIAGTLQKYKEIIDKYYLGEVDEEKLKEGAIKGYIEGLGDPYTEYISADEMEDYLSDTMGNFVGIGIYMVKNTEKGKIQVLAPIKGSPAEKAGIQAGDLILTVDGVDYSADEMTIASNKIKGEEGTTVTIEVLRGTETKKYELKREKVKVNQVEGKVLSNNIGYINFTSFDETTADDFKAKFEELNKQGIKSLIIDLRNNGGGIVDQALQIADYVADKDSVLLYEVDKNNKETVKKAKTDPIIINMPIIILTNENTASASEILAGALKDLGKAKTVGTTTYGKGVIQQILKLSDGSGLKVTIEEYQTPNRSKIHKIGIAPDEEVKLPDSVTNVLNVTESEDTQLQKAIEMLK